MRRPWHGSLRRALGEGGNDRPGPALAVLGALLDRSLVQIQHASEDARRYDRETIRSVTDVWDNNTFPLFLAATAKTPKERERRALNALTWMAGFGTQRRVWMEEQAAAAGLPLATLLPPAKPYVPGRDHRGFVMPSPVPVTAGSAAALATDYDLASTVVRSLQVERSGSRLDGFLRLALARAYPVGDELARGPALLDVWLEGVEEVAFDSHDAEGATLRPTEDGIAISIGARGMLRAASVTACPDDLYWHLSSAGGRADALTPPRDEASRRVRPSSHNERLGVTAEVAAHVLQNSMLEMRMVRYPRYADRVPLQDFCRAFAGAGEAVLAAGARRGFRRREAAFGDVIEQWARRGGPPLARWFSRLLREVTDRPDILNRTEATAQEHASGARPAPDTDRRNGSYPWPDAELRMASYRAAHIEYGTDREASAHLHLAVPTSENGPWRIRALQCAAPSGFHVRTAAFRGSGRPHTCVGASPGRTFALHDGALTVTSSGAWDIGSG